MLKEQILKKRGFIRDIKAAESSGKHRRFYRK